MQADRRWLPSELAAQMKQDGCRGLQSPLSQQSGRARAERSDAQTLLDDVVESVPHVEQRSHFGRKVFGLSAVVPVKVIAQKNVTPAEFKKRPVTPGSFVITRPAPSGPWAKNKAHRVGVLDVEHYSGDQTRRGHTRHQKACRDFRVRCSFVPAQEGSNWFGQLVAAFH